MAVGDDGASSDSAHSGGRAIADEVVEELNRQILDGRIPLGTWLRQDAVADDFKVSRTPVREAFRALQGQGVLEVHPRRGALVRGLSVREVRENYSVRAVLEGYAGSLAADHARDADIHALKEAAGEFESLVQRYLSREIDESAAATLWIQANEAFHSTVYQAAGNEQLRRSIRDLARRVPRNMTFKALAHDSHRLRINLDEHIAIAHAIEAHDAPLAHERALQHARRAAELVSRWYESTLSGPPRP
jgi:DNA-binding GntR family transcriptional regulator